MFSSHAVLSPQKTSTELKILLNASLPVICPARFYCPNSSTKLICEVDHYCRLGFERCVSLSLFLFPLLSLCLLSVCLTQLLTLTTLKAADLPAVVLLDGRLRERSWPWIFCDCRHVCGGLARGEACA